MPLNLDSPGDGSGGGEFYDKLRFNAQGGVWFLKQNDQEKRFNSGFKAVMDMENLQTGWARFNGSFVDFIGDPSLDTPAPMPANDSEDDKWKRAFKLLAYSKDAFGGTVEFMHQARTVTGAFNELYSAYEAKSGGGKLPVVVVDGDPVKVGDYYAPSWKIDKMVARPDALGSQPEAAAAVAAAPAAAAVDDEEF